MVNELSGHCAPLHCALLGVGGVGNARLTAGTAFVSPGRFSEFSRLDVFREGSALM
jgi:hypothetical protein